MRGASPSAPLTIIKKYQRNWKASQMCPAVQLTFKEIFQKSLLQSKDLRIRGRGNTKFSQDIILLLAIHTN